MKNINFPEHWEVMPLERALNVFDKKRIPLNEKQRQQMPGKYPYCGANGVVDYVDDYLFDDEYILLSEDGGYWGAFENSAYLMSGKFWVNNHAHVLQAKQGLSHNYFLMCQLNYLDIKPFISGTTRGKLNQGMMKRIPLALPPLPEQLAIAKVLQTIQEAKFTRQREIALERERKAALMDYLFSHGTKSKLRKQTQIGEIPESWEVAKLGDVLNYIGNGLTDKQNKIGDGYPVTRIETISDDCINAEKVGYIKSLTNNKIKKYRLRYGDILVSHINSDPQLGRAVIYEGKPELLIHGMNLLRMQANTEVINPFFLNFIFGVYRNRGIFIALASRAVGQSSINQSRMKSLMIPLPSLSEQDTISQVLQAIDARVVALEKEVQHLEELFHAMLEELMTGKRSAIPLIENGGIQ